jgi:hypothetical protein
MRPRSTVPVVIASMMWTNIRFIAGSIGMAACVGEVVVVWLRNVIFQWARLDGSPFERRQGYVCPTFVVWKKRLVFAFVEVLNQKLDNGWLVIRKTDDSTLCFLGNLSGSGFLPLLQSLTFPPNFRLRAKNSARWHTMTLWTLCVSSPQLMVRSEYAPDLRTLEASQCDGATATRESDVMLRLNMPSE